MATAEEKSCSACEKTLSVEHFHRKGGRPVGRCKACVSLARRTAYATDAGVRQKIAEAGKSYRQANRDKVRAQKQAYYLENKPQINATNRARQHLYSEARKAWRAGNRDRAIAGTKRWVSENRAQYNSAVREHMRSRRVKTSGGDSATEVRKWEAAQIKCCRWCGCSCDDDYHVDHMHPIALGGEHKIKNLAISCPPCNRKKGAMPLEAWLLKIDFEGRR